MTTLDNFDLIFEKQGVRRLVWVENIITGLRWVFFLAALLSSYKHVQWAFALLEKGEGFLGQATSYLAAAAIEAVIALLAYQRQRQKMEDRVQQQLMDKKETGEQNGRFGWGFEVNGLILFGAISTIANMLHGYHTVLDKTEKGLTLNNVLGLGFLDHIIVITFAATLPFVVFFLGESVKMPGEEGVVTQLVEFLKNLRPTMTALRDERDQLETERDQLKRELDHALSARDQASGRSKQAVAERDQLETECNQLKRELDQLRTAVTKGEQAVTFFNGANEFVQDLVYYHMTDAGDNRPSQDHLAKKWELSKGVMNNVLKRANGYKPVKVTS